ncbi:MAG: S24 family peptidase [Bacteroidales bacterium]|nr:S24 family peptidase [Bacteroidales bacterium]
MQYSVLFDTLQNLINYKPTAAEVANCLGVKDKALYARRARNSEFTHEELRKIEQAYGILGGLTGGVVTNDNCVDVDYYPDVFGSCGGGAFVLSQAKEKIRLDKGAIINYSPSKEYSIITAQGDSMAPDIKSDDKLIIEHCSTITDNKIHVFCYQEQIYVKRLVKNINELVIISDNPDKTIYTTQKLSGCSLDEVQVIGQVIGLMRERV